MTIVLLIITALLWGTTPILEKIGLGRTTPFMAMTIRSLSISTVLVIYLAVAGKFKDIFSLEPKSILIFSTSGIMAGLIGMWTYFGALKLNPTSKIVPITATYPLITTMLGILILKEGITPGRLIGTILIILGVWFVK